MAASGRYSNSNKKSNKNNADSNGRSSNASTEVNKDNISSSTTTNHNKSITSHLSIIGGGKPLKKGSCYSSDNKYFLQAFNNGTLKVFYIPTRQCVNTFNISKKNTSNNGTTEESGNSHLADIRLDPLVNNIVWIFDVSESISIINWKDGKSWNLKNSGFSNLNSIVDFRFNFSLNSYEMIYICGKISQNSTHKKYLKKLYIKVTHLQESIPSSMALNKPNDALFDYNSLSNSLEVINLVPLGKVVQYAQSLNSKHLIVSTINSTDNSFELKHIELKSFKILPEKINSTLKIPKKNKISTLAISNSGLCAIGYHSGIIEVIYNFMASTSFDLTDTKVLRWHINAVTALAFTRDSSYLLSGGKENVLVFWQIEMEKHQFLPRLNGHITQITISGSSILEESYIDQKTPDTVAAATSSADADFYTLTLEIPDTMNNETEILVLNSLELTSRLSVCGMRIATSTPLSQLAKEQRRVKKSTDTFHGIQNDYTSSAVSPVPDLQQLLLASGAELQCFNILADKPAYNVNVAAKISYGKVKAELSLKDPQLVHYKMTTMNTGGNVVSWLATVDKQEIPAAHLGNTSGSRISYVLKFWRKKTAAASAGSITGANTKKTDDGSEWELFTKIVDPHGASVNVASLIAAPVSYFNGLAFLTMDYLGGLRIWRPIKKQTNDSAADAASAVAWSLRRIITPILSNSNNNGVDNERFPVCCDWSEDSSLFVLSMKNSIYKLDMSDMSAEWEFLDKMSGIEGVVKWLKLSKRDYNLYVMTDSSMNSDSQGDLLTKFNLINGTPTQKLKLRNSNSNNGSENNGAASTITGAATVANANSTNKSQLKYSSNLMDCWYDSSNNEYLAIAMNYIFNGIKHIIVMFKNGQRLPAATIKGDHYLITLKTTGNDSTHGDDFSGFIYLDSQYNVGRVVPQSSGATANSLAYTKKNKIADSHGIDSSLHRIGLIQVHGANLPAINKDEDGDVAMNGRQEVEEEEGFWYGKKINNHTFNSVLSNDLEGIDMVDLFNAIVECV